MSDLTGRVAVVTGAASGIGAASATELASRGARVVVADVNEGGAKDVADAIVASGGEAVAQQVELAEESSIVNLIEATVRTFGGVDILHNNAAASGPEVMGRDFDVLTMDVAVWDAAFAVNLRAMMLTCKHALPHMIAQGKGVVVNMSSNSALAGDLSRVAYGASKGGVNSLTLYVATMYGKQGIRCNAISPGLVMTPAAEHNLTDFDREVFAGSHLTNGIGKPEDIAKVVAFLASDDSAFITGEVIRVDGGMLSHTPVYAQYLAAATEAAEAGGSS
jgi:NAD(P)-dependent dehydrogenase (short-subunit alcohol dehydrogenase family)